MRLAVESSHIEWHACEASDQAAAWIIDESGISAAER